MPDFIENRVAWLRLISSGSQKPQELVRGDIVLAERKSPDSHTVLRPLGIEATRLARWTSHHEFARGDCDHDWTERTLLEFTGRLIGMRALRCRDDQERERKDREQSDHGGVAEHEEG